MRRRWLPVLFGVLLAALAAQAGCAVPLQATVTIVGTVLGDSMSSSAAGATSPVAATVTCNGVSTVADSDGHFTLSVPQASAYACAARKRPSYAAETVRIAGHTQSRIELDFGASHAPACRLAATTAVECEQLHFEPGSLRGTVAYTHSGAPAAGITVQCPDLAHFSTADVSVNWLHAKTDQTGAFSLPNIAAGTYTCLARDDHDNMTAQKVTVTPGGTARASFSICTASCPPVHYHFGNVMHQYHAYLIYWTPAGSPLEPGGGSGRFTSLVQRYFRDVGGTPYFGILTQYWDYQGYVQNASALSGTWTDTTPYQHCSVGATTCQPAYASQKDPLLDSDIEAEVARAIKANPSWHTGLDSEFVVFTGLGAEECFTSDANSDCSYKPDHGFCGYHSSFQASFGSGLADEAIYAYVPNVGNDGGLCTFSNFISPNGDSAADSAITIVSHEQFESISDPLPNDAPGWFDDVAEQSREGGEIADKCVRYFGTIRGDGSNVTLAHGDRYILQGEWSNQVGGCTLG